MRPAAVLFDCDGVIVDSEPITDQVIADSFARHGFDMATDQIASLFTGGTLASAADAARSRGAALPESWIDDTYAQIFTRLATGTPLIPGITEVFAALDAAPIPYAVASNGPHRKMRIMLAQHPAILTRLEGRLFSREDVARPKPAPDLYLHAARALGAKPETCVVIEDSPTGIRAARAAGMRCLAYAPHRDPATLTALGAHPFTQMADLPGLLHI